MTQHDTYIGRRPVLKGAGMTLAGLAGLTGSAAAKGGKGKGGGKQPLEETPSLTAAVFSGGLGTEIPFPGGAPGMLAGQLFDTTSAETTPNGQVIHYQLQFGVDSKPYVLTHDDDGQYTSKGSVINFELDKPSQELGLDPGKYRATVRDVVQLYEKGGYFDWSVTRTDFFVRPGMDYLFSSLIIVWDEDGPANSEDEEVYRTDPTGTPMLHPDILGQNVYDAIESNANRLIDSGPSNPGGQ